MHENGSDATIIGIESQQRARESQLIPVAHEITDDHYFIAFDKTLSDEQLNKEPMYVQCTNFHENSPVLTHFFLLFF